jgi:hypothetical protein
MAIPTVDEIIDGIQDELADSSGRVFPDAVALKGFQRAFRFLKGEMLKRQIPRSKKVATYRLVAGAASLTPAAAGIANFGELIRLEERLYGSSEQYGELDGPLDEMPQRTSATSLCEFEWREDTFWFTAATTDRELRITYFESDQPPTTGSVGIDGSYNFLVAYGASVIAPWRGYEERGAVLRFEAVGRDGHGGYLYDLLSPMVRSLPGIQPAAYDLGGSRRKGRAAPYIPAPLPEGVLSSITVSGTQDGVNATFTLSAAPAGALALFKNGQKLKQGVGFTLSGATVTFLSGYIPEADDVLEAII